MATVYLALGANVGDPKKQIEQAFQLLGAELNNITRAPVYRSRAVGHTDQPDFLNTALRAETSLTPDKLLAFTQAVEQEIGRVERFRWGPREIDIDIIFYDDLVRKTGPLTLPHPLFQERDFVLRPLADLDPGLRDPLSGLTVTALLKKISSGKRAISERT
jgi:2-amino-4-hydroxy-6-hydroxymethyldihydropteridine diphosphokinase